MTEFGDCVLISLKRHALVNRFLNQVSGKRFGGSPKSCIGFEFACEHFKLCDSDRRRAVRDTLSEAFRFWRMRQPPPGELTDQLWVGSRFSPDLSIIQ